jgi:class 3 adenylate cyclase
VLTASLAACLACAAPLPPGADLCPGCGSPQDQASRRVVTVLFADLVGYTRLSSTLDVEQLHVLVRPFMNALRQVCLSLGGQVPTIEGDGFMAVFGALRTQEDDTHRALLASARMQALAHERRKAHGDLIPLLRIGVNSGEVLVVPSWEQVGFSLAGDPVNVGSRLCALAAEGTVLASQDTVDLVPDVPGWGVLQTVAVRNRTEPVRVRELDWVALAESPDVERDWTTPFIGRADLLTALDAAVAAGQVALVIGEPGIGKTRLAVEWSRRQHSRVLLRARFASFDEGTTSPLAALLNAVPAGVLDRAGGSALTRRRVQRLRGHPVDATETDTRAELLSSLVDVLARVAAEVPLAVCIDDAHAAGAEERAVLARLCGELAAAGAAVVLTSREPIDIPAQDIVVPFLLPGEMRALVEALLPDASEHVHELLVSRTSGNPLFVEQCVRLLVEQDLRPEEQEERLLSVPTMMRVFVAARFDLLSEQQKNVLRTAAVLSEDVEIDLLRHLSGSGKSLDGLVDTMVQRGLLRWESRDAPEPPVLQFCHQLVRDVAYQEITKRQRIAVHRAAAEWYGTLPVVQVLASEAMHLEAAVALGAGDCELVRRAVEVIVYWSRSVMDERPLLAADALVRAGALVAAHPQCAVDTLALSLAQAHVSEQSGAFQVAAEAAQAAETAALERDLGPEAALAALLRARAVVMTSPQEALDLLDVAATRFAALGDQTGVARVEVERARARAHEGLAPRVEAYRVAHRVAVQSGDTRLASLAAQDLALHTTVMDLAEGQRWAQTARELLRADDAVGQSRLATAATLAALLRADFAGAIELADVARQMAGDTGAVQLAIMSTLYGIEARILSGDLEGAETVLTQARVVAAGRATEHLTLDLDLHSALLLGRSGRVGEALDDLERVQDRCLALNVDFERQRFLFVAQVAFDGGRFAEAATAAVAAAALDDELGTGALGLRSRVLVVATSLATRRHVGLRELSQLRQLTRSSGAVSLEAELTRWAQLDDLLRGHPVQVGEPLTSGGVPGALDLEVRALASATPDHLLAAAAAWHVLGTTVWEARALLWHTELTGMPHPEAEAILSALGAPERLARTLREQVRSLAG